MDDSSSDKFKEGGLTKGRSFSDIFRAVFPLYEVPLSNDNVISSNNDNINEWSSNESKNVDCNSDKCVRPSLMTTKPILKAQSLASFRHLFSIAGFTAQHAGSQTSLSRNDSAAEIVDDVDGNLSKHSQNIFCPNKKIFSQKMETIPGSPNIEEDNFAPFHQSQQLLLQKQLPQQQQPCKKTNLLERLVRTEKFTLNNKEINAFAPTSQ
ncbi:hypothetical protein HELRODRAFT_173540 [Helobdella robusta]|uniref:Uncharacterized protein n=1 Tax=Helobdella robusta TaxID=6412 RepID=T1F6Y6_HELRO|nr:hypothetical protein HELRODRAFT_173540 [Helobdella robusta]ESO03261.1 hypothetical protein HELRODRAFT_173540 [Helobdella robusta]